LIGEIEPARSIPSPSKVFYKSDDKDIWVRLSYLFDRRHSERRQFLLFLIFYMIDIFAYLLLVVLSCWSTNFRLPYRFLLFLTFYVIYMFVIGLFRLLIDNTETCPSIRIHRLLSLVWSSGE
jgi:hypothetical protein